MTRKLLLFVVLIGAAAAAQTTPTPAAGKPQAPPAQPQTTPPAPGATTAAPQAPTTPPVQPAGTRRLPQATTQEEFDAFNAIRRLGTSADAEKAAAEFSEKYPNSELRAFIYQGLMDAYQGNNLADKAIEMGRKSLSYDPNNPVVLILLASVIAERTRETDLDRDQRHDEAVKYAQHGLETVATDLVVPAGTPPEKVQQLRQLLSAMAHAAIGFVELSRHNDAAAEQHLRQAAQLNTVQPDPMVYLRLAIALDHLNRYPEALQAANKVLSLTTNGTVADLARREKERLEKLIGSSPAAPAAPQAGPAPAPNPPAAKPAVTNPPPAEKPKA